ncbi:Uncharacterised protein [Neisseria meningitidis]|nr:Uncharacterised protein [Neisseria meningitidis]
MQQSTKATGGLPPHGTPAPTLPPPHTRPTPTAPLSDGTFPSLPTCPPTPSTRLGGLPVRSIPTAIPPILSPVFPKRYGNLKQMPSELPFQTALRPNDSISSVFFTFNHQVCPNHRHPSRHRSHRRQKMLPIRHRRYRATAAFDFRAAQQPVQQHIRNTKQQRVFQTLQPKNQPRPHDLPPPIPTTILYRFRAMLK